ARRSVALDSAPAPGGRTAHGAGAGGAAGGLRADDLSRPRRAQRGGGAGLGRTWTGRRLRPGGGLPHRPDRPDRRRGAGVVDRRPRRSPGRSGTGPGAGRRDPQAPGRPPRGRPARRRAGARAHPPRSGPLAPAARGGAPSPRDRGGGLGGPPAAAHLRAGEWGGDRTARRAARSRRQGERLVSRRAPSGGGRGGGRAAGLPRLAHPGPRADRRAFRAPGRVRPGRLLVRLVRRLRAELEPLHRDGARLGGIRPRPTAARRRRGRGPRRRGVRARGRRECDAAARLRVVRVGVRPGRLLRSGGRGVGAAGTARRRRSDGGRHRRPLRRGDGRQRASLTGRSHRPSV
ncbi:MAG: Transcriptional regulator, DeoR family, partial [uncultured Thermomicrobiales bacterium]